MRVLDLLARFSALFAGTVMMAVALATCGSIVSRQFFGSALLGDFELVQVGMAFSVAAFMPLCQLRRGNIIVDFFTTGASERTRNLLDRIGCLLIALATRELLSQLRDMGEAGSGPAPFAKKDRSEFLQKLDTIVQAIRRAE